MNQSKLDLLEQINTNSPRETLVYNWNNLVIKRPVAKNSPALLKNWLGKQVHAKEVTQSLVSKPNPAYYVPDMLEISTNEYFVVEQRVPGKPITSAYFETLAEEDIDIIYNGLAHFINDINQTKPVLTQKAVFDMESDGDDVQNLAFNVVLEKIKKHLSDKETKTVKKAKSYFDKASEKGASVVFSQGDMNEHNIFYDKNTKTVSFIDFADAKYENANHMFTRNFARLGWLDIERAISDYEALPRQQPVIVKADKNIFDLRNALYSFKWPAIEFLKNPKVATAIRLKLIKDSIANLSKIMTRITSEQIAEATKVMKAVERFKDKTNDNVVVNDRQNKKAL